MTTTREDKDSWTEMLAKIPVTETRGSLLSAIDKLLRVLDISENSIMIPTLFRDKCEFDAYELLTLAKILKASILGHNDLVEFYMSESSSQLKSLVQQQRLSYTANPVRSASSGSSAGKTSSTSNIANGHQRINMTSAGSSSSDSSCNSNINLITNNITTSCNLDDANRHQHNININNNNSIKHSRASTSMDAHILHQKQQHSSSSCRSLSSPSTSGSPASSATSSPIITPAKQHHIAYRRSYHCPNQHCSANVYQQQVAAAVAAEAAAEAAAAASVVQQQQMLQHTRECAHTNGSLAECSNSTDSTSPTLSSSPTSSASSSAVSLNQLPVASSDDKQTDISSSPLVTGSSSSVNSTASSTTPQTTSSDSAFIGDSDHLHEPDHDHNHNHSDHSGDDLLDVSPERRMSNESARRRNYSKASTSSLVSHTGLRHANQRHNHHRYENQTAEQRYTSDALHLTTEADHPNTTIRLLLQIEQLKTCIPHVTHLFESIIELYKSSVDTIT